MFVHVIHANRAASLLIRGPVWSSHYDESLMHRIRVQSPGANLGGKAGHYPTPAVEGMS